jgi:DNA-binding transcriptional ArsR family regulator
MRSTPSLDATFSALADPTRRAILARLALGEATVNEIAAPFAISLPAVSRHLKVLARAALIVRTRDGQHRRCRLNARALNEAAEWLVAYRRFWNEGFDRLDEHLRTSRKSKEKSHGKTGQARRRGS